MIAGKCFSFASRARLCRFAQPGRAARHRAFASDAGLVLLGLGRGARPCKEKPRAGRGELSMTKGVRGVGHRNILSRPVPRRLCRVAR